MIPTAHVIAAEGYAGTRTGEKSRGPTGVCTACSNTAFLAHLTRGAKRVFAQLHASGWAHLASNAPANRGF